jgi:hypothetical protein
MAVLFFFFPLIPTKKWKKKSETFAERVMVIKTVVSVCFGWLCVLTLLAQQPQSGRARVTWVKGTASNKDLAFQAAISKPENLGDKVSLYLEIRNQSKSVMLFVNKFRGAFEVDISRKDGKPVPKTAFERSRKEVAPRLGSISILSLASGKTASMVADLGAMFDLTEHGDYIASIEAYYHIEEKSEVIKIEQLAFEIHTNTWESGFTEGEPKKWK